MIIYYKKNSWKEQINQDIIELNKYKDLYENRINLYHVYLNYIKNHKDSNIEYRNKISEQELNNSLANFKKEIQIIDKNISLLDEMLSKCNLSKKMNLERKKIYSYNKKYEEIKDKFLNYYLSEDNTNVLFIKSVITESSLKHEKANEKKTLVLEKTIEKSNKYDDKLISNVENTSEKKEISTENLQSNKKIGEKELKNNDTLLISEKLNKVFLPYTAKEVEQIYNNENSKYKDLEEVINENFVRDFSDYNFQFLSRYKETMKLAKEREGYSIFDSIVLATEMIGKRFLHPAIISACRNIYELDVYLDCLDKNELEDFKIFKIKFELYPMIVKQDEKVYESLEHIDSADKIDSKSQNRKNKTGTRFKENTKTSIWNKTKRMSKRAEHQFERRFLIL
ncbi:MAG: hypothetical protein IKG14_01395 [Clostridia bacterium]|nr:hypothetical protein [Clostridia bacterium]